MKAAKTKANEMFRKQFLIVGVAVFLLFSVTTIFVLGGKCQEVIFKQQLAKSSERQESEAHSDTEDEEVTFLQPIDRPEFVVPEGDYESDFLMQLWAPRSRKGSKIVGIGNLGNSCYANSTLQALFRVPEIKKVVFNLDIYLPRLAKDLDELLMLVKANERFIKFKSAFLNLYGRDLSLENLLARFRAFIETIPAEKIELKEKLQESLSEFEILSLFRKLQLNLRMIDKVHLKPKSYQRAWDMMKVILTDSIKLLDQIIAALERSRKKVNDKIVYARKKKIVLINLLKTSNAASNEFENICRFAEISKFILALDDAVKLLVENDKEVRRSGLANNFILESHGILKEASIYYLYESKKYDTKQINDRIEALISAYKIVEGLQSVFKALQSNPKGSPVIIERDALKLQVFPGKFARKGQEDVEEYFLTLMEAIKAVIPSSQSKHIGLTKLIKKVLRLPEGFEDENRLDIREEINHIPLMVSGGLNFEISLGMFFAENEIPDVSSENHNDQNGTLIETVHLENIPRVVTISLKRFEFNGDRSVKINDKFQMPEYIDFTPNVEPRSETQLIYRVKTIVYHSGSCNGGHYYSYTRDGNDWYLLNDSLAEKASEKFVKNALEHGYIYFYEREEILALNE